MKTHAWQFAARFRRNAFGWRSGPPVQRIREALAEIRQVARKEPVLAAEGAVRLLEKLSPALMQVDSSSGALGAAVDNAIQALVPVIAGAEIEPAQRQRWLERLWQALQDDEMPYIESLADYWGELCATPALASRWGDRFIPEVQSMWRRDDMVYGYFKGAPACLSALLAAGRCDELLALIDQKPARSWHFRRWGVQALVAMGGTPRRSPTLSNSVSSTTRTGRSPRSASPSCCLQARPTRPTGVMPWPPISGVRTWPPFGPLAGSIRTSNPNRSCTIWWPVPQGKKASGLPPPRMRQDRVTVAIARLDSSLRNNSRSASRPLLVR